MGWFKLGWLDGLVNERHLKHFELKLWSPLMTSTTTFLKIGPKLAKLEFEVIGWAGGWKKTPRTTLNLGFKI